jgi:hypothetical protein
MSRKEITGKTNIVAKIKASNFKRLIGIWQTTGQIVSGNNTLQLEGRDTYEFILDGHFILHKADVTLGNEKSETFEIIGLDNARDQDFNSRGENGTMTGKINNNDFLIIGQGIRFEGTINNENTIVVGKWYLQSENKSWNEFIELKLEKQT